MRSLSGVELGMSFGACGFVVVALMVAVCCVLWWGRRAISRGLLQVCRKSGRDILLQVLFSGMKKKNGASSSTVDVDPCQICSSVVITVDQLESTTSEEEEEDESSVEEPLEDENWSGPPWFLFTIREETEEEMKALAEEEEIEEKSGCTAERRETPLTLADFLDQGCPESSSPVPKSAAPSLAKLKSMKFEGKKTNSIPFHPLSPVVAAPGITDSCHSSSSSAGAIDGPYVTIIVE